MSRCVQGAVLLFLLSACTEARDCAAGSPMMPVCEPAPLQILPEPHLVFMSNHEGSFQIYTMNSDGTGLTRLTSGPGTNLQPMWSPDGTEIAFSSTRTGTQEIFVMSADGTNQRNITNHPSVDGFPSWSPDGRRIAFHSFRDGTRPQIFVMNSDGSEVRQLTQHRMAYNSWPRWSPDGSRIVFASDRGGWGQLFVMNPDGTDQRRLTGEGMNHFPAWSADGRHIAWEALRMTGMAGGAAMTQIYLMRADGTGQMNRSMSSAEDGRPTWSRAGTIYFVSNRSGSRELWAMNPDGSAQRQLTDLRAVVEVPNAK